MIIIFVGEKRTFEVLSNTYTQSIHLYLKPIQYTSKRRFLLLIHKLKLETLRNPLNNNRPTMNDAKLLFKKLSLMSSAKPIVRIQVGLDINYNLSISIKT